MGTNPKPGLLEPMGFEPDPSSRRKKGTQRPVFAEVFQNKGEAVDLPSKVHLLVNPYSGKKKGRSVAQRVIELVKEAGVEIDASYSAYSGHLVTMASALVLGKNDLIAVVGGDGSLSEAITGRMLLGKKDKDTGRGGGRREPDHGSGPFPQAKRPNSTLRLQSAMRLSPRCLRCCCR